MTTKMTPIDPRHARPAYALVLGALCVLTACAAASEKRASAPATDSQEAPSVMDMSRQSSPHERIEALWAEIEDQRGRAGMTEPIAAGTLERMANQPIPDVRTSCEPPAQPSTTCQDVCTLSASICDNAESICRLSGELGDDDWASDKCQHATAACAESTSRCCACE